MLQKTRFRKKGITLLNLVIVIIVILILSGALIITIMNSDSIIHKSNEAKNETERASEKAELRLAVASYFMEETNLRPVGLSTYLQEEPYNYTVKDSEVVTENTQKLEVTVRKYQFEVETETLDGSNKNPGNISDGNKVDGENTDTGSGDNPGGDDSGDDNTGDNNGSIDGIEFKFNATSTSHNIKIAFEEEYYDNFTYTYYISKVPDDFSYYVKTTEKEYTFEKLDKDTDYYVKVMISDGQSSVTTDEVVIRTQQIPDVDKNEIMLSHGSATYENVSITSIYNNPEYSLMYKVNDGEPKEYTSAIILEENAKVVFYLQDITGQQGNPYEVNVDYIDKSKPLVTNVIEEPSATDVQIVLEDVGSKIDKIALIMQNSEIPSDSNFVPIENNYEIIEEVYNEETNSYRQVIAVTGLVKNRAYYIWAKDKAGNMTEAYYLYCTANVNMTDEIVLSTESMTNTNITAELPVRTGLRTEYKIFYNDEEITEEKLNDENTWILFSEENITLSENCTIYYRYNFLNLKIGEYAERKVTNIDREAPTVKQIGSSVTSATVLCTDDISAVDKIAWTALQTLPQTWYEASEKYEVPVPENSTIYVYVKDEAGNVANTQVTSGPGFDITTTALGCTNASFYVEAKDERINKVSDNIYWYVGKEEVPPESEDAYVAKQYKYYEPKNYDFDQGEDYTVYYLHVKDDNGNKSSLQFRFDKADKAAPLISSSPDKYYANNEKQDLKVTLKEDTEVRTIWLYDSEKNLLEQIELSQIVDGAYNDYITITRSEDSKQVDLVITQVPKTSMYIKADDIKDNESELKTIYFNGDYDIPQASFTHTEWYKSEDNNLVDGYLSITDSLSGIKEFNASYVDLDGQTQVITYTEGQEETIEMPIPLTGIKNDTEIVITAKDVCENELSLSLHIEGDFDGPNATIDENQVEYIEDETTSCMYATNAVINVFDNKAGILAYTIEYIDKDGTTQTISEEGITSEDGGIQKIKSVTIPNFKPKSSVKITATDNCNNSSELTYTLGNETEKPTVEAKNFFCEIDESGNKIITGTIVMGDVKSGLSSYNVSYISDDGQTEILEASSLNGKSAIEDLKFSIPNNSKLRVVVNDVCENQNILETETLIDNVAPKITIGDESYVDGKINVTVVMSDLIENFDLSSGISEYKVSYIVDGQTQEITLEEGKTSSVQYRLAKTYSVPNKSTVKVVATDYFGNTSEEVTKKVEDITAPEIVIIDADITWLRSSSSIYPTSVKVKFEDTQSGVASYLVEYTNRNNEVKQITKSDINSSYAVCEITDLKVDTTINVEAYDCFGNLAEYSKTISFEKIEPGIRQNLDHVYYKNEQGENYVEVNLTIFDQESGLYSYNIEYGESLEEQLTTYKKEEDLNGTTNIPNILVQVPNNSIIKITVEDICGNITEWTILASDKEAPECDIEKNMVYECTLLSDDKIKAEGTILVEDEKSGVYQYRINDGEWITVPSVSDGKYPQEFEIPFEAIEDEHLKVEAKDYFGNIAVIFDETFIVENTICIQDINIEKYDKDTGKISGTVTITSESEFKSCLLTDESHATIKNRTPDVYGKKEQVISFTDMPKAFYIEVENIVKKSAEVLIGDNNAPKLDSRSNRPYIDENGQIFIDVTLNITDIQSQAQIIGGEPKVNEANGSGLYQYKLIINGEEEDWIDIPQSAGAYVQDYAISIPKVSNGANLKVVVKDVIGNETTLDIGTIKEENDIVIKDMNITEWDVNNQLVSGTISIQAKEKGLKDCKIMYNGSIIGTPQQFNGSTEEQIVSFDNIPNGAKIVVTNQWGETKEEVLGDVNEPSVEIENVTYNVDERNVNIIELTVQDDGSGLDSLEMYYISSTGEEKSNTIKEYNGESSDTVTIEVPNDAKNLQVIVKDRMDNESSETFYATSIADNEAPRIAIDVTGYIIEDGKNYILGNVNLSDSDSKIKSYEIKNGENVIDTMSGLNTELETISFKIENNTELIVTATDICNNVGQKTEILADISGPDIVYEYYEYYKIDDKEMIKIKYDLEDGKSGLSECKIEIDGQEVSLESIDTTNVFTGYFDAPNNSNVKIIATDYFGNTSTQEFEIQEDSLMFPEVIPKPEVESIEPEKWTADEVTVTLIENEKYELQYIISGSSAEEAEWLIYSGPFEVSENCTIDFRYYNEVRDEYGETSRLDITNIDKEEPQITITSKNISSVYMNITDDASGVTKIAVTETENEPTDEEWFMVSINEDGTLSDNGQKEYYDTITDLENEKPYYAWAVDAAGRISGPVEFMTSIKDIGELNYAPTELTNSTVTITLPKSANLTTTYQVVKKDQTFDESAQWTEYTDPFTVDENCVIYYRYEYGEYAGNYATFNITNIDKEGPVVDFAIMIDSTLNIEYTEENKIVGYVIKEENVAPTEYDFTENIIQKGSNSFSITGLNDIETDKSYYVWLMDEVSNISEQSMEFKKVKVTPNNTFKEYTSEEVPVEIYVPNMTSIFVGIESFDPNVNEEVKQEVIDSGFAENQLQEIQITDGSSTFNSIPMPISGTIKFKVVADGKTSKEYTFGVHNIDLEGPAIEILEQTITSLKVKYKDEKAGLFGVAVEKEDDGSEVLLKLFAEVGSFESLDSLTQEQIDSIPNEYTTDELTLVPNTKYVIAAIDMFQNESGIIIDTTIETPGEGKTTPENVVNANVTVELPTKEYEKLSGEIIKYTTQYRLIVGETEGEWTNYESEFEVTENCIVEYRYEYMGYYGQSAQLEIDNIDRTGPQTTIKGYNSYSVLINAIDKIAGVKGYYISEDSTTPEVSQFTSWGTSEEDKLVTGLTSNKTYYVWTIDNIDNISQAVSFETKLGELGEASLSDYDWTNKDIQAILPKEEISTTNTEYQVITADETFDENATWSVYNEPITISQNCVIYYRYNDGQQVGGYATLNVTNIDKVKPEFSIDYVLMDNSIILTGSDDLSQIGGYIASKSATGNVLSNKQIYESNEITIQNLSDKTKYYIWVVDKAGNISESYEVVTTGTYEPKTGTIDPVTVTLPQRDGYSLQYQINDVLDDGWIDYTVDIVVEENCAINYRYVKDNVISNVCTFNVDNIKAEDYLFETKGVNPPQLSDGMIPIKWNGQKWVVCDLYDEEWYDYTDQAAGVDGSSRWANVMLSDGYYKADTVELGTEVEQSQLGSMFVWIPRYAYAITEGYHTGGETVSGTIKISFLHGTDNYNTGDTINYYYQGVESEAVLTNATGSGNWNEHPAFTFGDKKVTGIWFSKFNASMSGATVETYNTASTNGYKGGTSETLKVVPDVSAWRYINLSDSFDYCLNMNANDGNIYQLSSDKSVIDTHLVKNVEYGAALYLAHSNYGRNGNSIKYTTAESVTYSATVKPYVLSAGYTLNEAAEAVSYVDSGHSTTTNNITGIYDFSNPFCTMGTAAYVANSNASLTTNGNSLYAADAKYKDVYKVSTVEDTTPENFLVNTDRIGDAIYEISSDYFEEGSCNSGFNVWQTSTLAGFPYGEYAFFARHYTSTALLTIAEDEEGTNANLGVPDAFIFDDYNGGTYEAIGFRPAIVVY